MPEGPVHVIATGRIPIEVDREDFDRFRDEVDRWLDELPARLKRAFDLAPALADARDKIGDEGFVQPTHADTEPRPSIPEADFGEKPPESKPTAEAGHFREEELSEKVSELTKQVDALTDIVKGIPDLLESIRSAVEEQ